MVFRPKHTDFELSPYTGITRESWIEAAEYLLTGVFNNIKSIDDPVVMRRRSLIPPRMPLSGASKPSTSRAYAGLFSYLRH